MKIAPLIYSRTGQQDYFGNFAVRPRGFPIDISWAAKKVRSAMNGVSKVNRRFLVLSQNDFCIAGVAFNMRYFVNNGTLTSEEKAEAKDYTIIERRLYPVFLGYVFKCSSSEIPVVTDSDLWQMFKEKLIPIWNDGRASAVEVDYYFECKSEPLSADKIEVTAKYLDVLLYDTAKIPDEFLFKEYLSRAYKENVAFCSGVDSISMLEKFTAVSTSTDIIDILKHKQKAQEKENLQKEKEHIEKEQIEQKIFQEKLTQKKTPSLKQTNHCQTTILNQSKKSDTTKFLTIVIAIIVIVTVAVTFYLVNHSENPRKLQSSLKNLGKSANISSALTINTTISSKTTKCLKNLEKSVNISSIPAKEWSVS